MHQIGLRNLIARSDGAILWQAAEDRAEGASLDVPT
jgi:hypothetical protein